MPVTSNKGKANLKVISIVPEAQANQDDYKQNSKPSNTQLYLPKGSVISMQITNPNDTNQSVKLSQEQVTALIKSMNSKNVTRTDACTQSSPQLNSTVEKLRNNMASHDKEAMDTAYIKKAQIVPSNNDIENTSSASNISNAELSFSKLNERKTPVRSKVSKRKIKRGGYKNSKKAKVVVQEAVTPKGSDQDCSYFISKQTEYNLVKPAIDNEVSYLNENVKMKDKPRPSPLRSLQFEDANPLPRLPSDGFIPMSDNEFPCGLGSPLVDGLDLNTPTFQEFDMLDSKSPQGQSVFQFPPCSSPASGIETKVQDTTPTLHISDVSSPVMLLPHNVATNKAPLPRVPAASLNLNQSDLICSQDSSPATTLKFGSSGICPLERNLLEPTVLPRANRTPLMTSASLVTAPSNICSSQAKESPSPIQTPVIIPGVKVPFSIKSSVPRPILFTPSPIAAHHTKGISPSAGSMFNMAKYLSDTQENSVLLPSSDQLSFPFAQDTIYTSHMPAGLEPSDILLTPTERPTVAPNTENYFRTPSGLFPLCPFPSVNSSGTSAFYSVLPRSKPGNGMDMPSAARKLEIINLD